MNLGEKTPVNLGQAKSFIANHPPLMDTPSMISVSTLIQHLGESIYDTRVLASRLEDRVSGILGPRRESRDAVAPCPPDSQHMNEILLRMIYDIDEINNRISINVLRMEEGIGY